MARIQDSVEKAGKETIENMAQGLMVRVAVDSADSKSFVRKIFEGLRKVPDAGLSMAASTIGHSVKGSKYFTPEIRELLGTFFIASAPAVAEWKRRHADDAEGFANEAAMRWEVQRLDAGVPEWKSPGKPREPHLGTVLDSFTLDQERVYLKASAFALFERQGDHAHSKPLEGNAARTLMGMFEAARRAPDFAKRHIPTDKRTMRVLNRMRDLTNEGRRGGKDWTRYAKEFVCRNWDLYEGVLTTYIAENKELEATDVLRAIQDTFDDLGNWAGVKKLIKIDELAEKAKAAKRKATFGGVFLMGGVGASLAYLLYLIKMAQDSPKSLTEFAFESAYTGYWAVAIILMVGAGVALLSSGASKYTGKDKSSWVSTYGWIQGAAIFVSVMFLPPLLTLAFAFAALADPETSLLVVGLPLVFLIVWDVLNWRLLNIILNSGTALASSLKEFLGGEEKAKDTLQKYAHSVALKRIGVTAAMAVSAAWIEVFLGRALGVDPFWIQLGFGFMVLGAIAPSYLSSYLAMRSSEEYPSWMRSVMEEFGVADLRAMRRFRNTFIILGLLMPFVGKGYEMIGADNVDKIIDVAGHKRDKLVNSVSDSVEHGKHSTKKQRSQKRLDCDGLDRNLRSCQ